MSEPVGETYRYILECAIASLRDCIPYVNGALHSDQPWRRETAATTMDNLRRALGQCERMEGKLRVRV